METHAPKAVFLSYASQDADAARRICEALRAAGVEVWFDQSELRGGDVWDQKIRRQIKGCALFLPIISAHTQERPEGYFRLEWLLAAERSRLMAEDVAFIVPIVIDNTSDVYARVPEKFRDVQWTRLLEGATPAAFLERIKTLLHGGTESGHFAEVQPSLSGAEGCSVSKQTFPSWLSVAVTGVAVFIVFVLTWRLLPKTANQPVAATRAALSAASMPPASAPVQALLQQIWRIYDLQQDGTQEQWTLAEDLGAQAVKLEPTNPEVWAAYALAGWGKSTFITTSSRTTSDEALRRAERAAELAPESDEARLAMANFQRSDAKLRPQVEATLREVLKRRPNDKRVLRLLAYTIRDNLAGNPDADARLDEAMCYLDQAAALPGGDASALTGKCSMLLTRGRHEEALAVAEAAVALRNGPAALNYKIGLLLYLKGDPEKADETLNTVPASFWRQDRNIVLASRVLLARGKSRAALSPLERLPDDWTSCGPRSLLTSEIHRRTGNQEAAQLDLRVALQTVDRRLLAAANAPQLLYWKCWLLSALGDRMEAQRVFLLWQQYSGNKGQPNFAEGRTGLTGVGTYETAALYLQVGEKTKVLEALDARAKRIVDSRNPDEAHVLRNRLRFDTMWDSLRDDPRFEAALVQLADAARGMTTSTNRRP